MKLLLLVPILALTACASTRNYQPVAPVNFEQLATQGCAAAGTRFNVDANISSAAMETVVLWNGLDAGRTVAVRLPPQGRASRLRGVVGKSVYDVNREVLRGLAQSGQPATFALVCERKGLAPNVLSVRYQENGVQREIEFK